MEALDRIANGFMQAKILLTAAELRVFSLLAGEGASASELAASVGLSLRGVEILLDALAAMELLDKEQGRYTLREEYAAWLVEGRGDSYLALLRHRNRMFRQWAFLEEIVRGQPPSCLMEHSSLHDPRTNRIFIEAMAAASAPRVPLVLDRLDLSSVRVFGDIGGGPGTYVREALRRAPHLEACLIDLPLTISVAEDLLSGCPDRQRLRLEVWDFYSGAAPDELPVMDLVLISQVLHAESPEKNIELLSRIHPLLAPGGRVVVHESLVGEERVAPGPAALFAVNMLAMTDGGRSYTAREIEEWGRATGFEPEGSEALDERSGLVFLRKV